MALAALALGHELIYLIAHGAGEGYAAAMREGGHDRYWTSFLLIVAFVTSALVAVSVAQIRRLSRLASGVRTGVVRMPDVGPSRFFGLLGPLWLRLSIAVVVAYVLQENIETATTGASLPSLGVLGGEHAVSLPVLLVVSLLVAAVGALVGWRREVIVERLRTAARARLRTVAAVRRPTLADDRPTGSKEGRRKCVRGPPSWMLAPA